MERTMYLSPLGYTSGGPLHKLSRKCYILSNIERCLFCCEPRCSFNLDVASACIVCAIVFLTKTSTSIDCSLNTTRLKRWFLRTSNHYHVFVTGTLCLLSKPCTHGILSP